MIAVAEARKTSLKTLAFERTYQQKQSNGLDAVSWGAREQVNLRLGRLPPLELKEKQSRRWAFLDALRWVDEPRILRLLGERSVKSASTFLNRLKKTVALNKIVSQAESSQLETLQAEIAHLKGELQLRDQLVEQLSQELFRLVKKTPDAASQTVASEEYQSQVERLKAQIADIEEQVNFDQRQISHRDAEIEELRNKVKTLTKRNQTLEKMLQDLPQIYRQKFAERMKPVKAKVEQLQQENQQLQAQVQTLTYRLTIKNRNHQDNDIDQRSQQAPSV